MENELECSACEYFVVNPDDFCECKLIGKLGTRLNWEHSRSIDCPLCPCEKYIEDSPIDLLLEVLDSNTNINQKAFIVQAYIRTYGPIPNEYGDLVRDLLKA